MPHHAKAGNINCALLQSGLCRGDFALVLDCDMVAHPDFLQRTLGHFYHKRSDGKHARWVPKPKAAFLQVRAGGGCAPGAGGPCLRALARVCAPLACCELACCREARP